jgi:hypothetical protein
MGLAAQLYCLYLGVQNHFSLEGIQLMLLVVYNKLIYSQTI